MRRPRGSEDYREFSKVKTLSDSEVWISSKKTWGDLKIALIFPNSYRVGSSSLSFSFVKTLLELHPAVVVNRFYYDPGFSRFYSLDSLRPLDEFEIWAFSVHFELDVLNVLDVLEKRGVPLRWRDRNDSHPLVIVGGALSYFNADSFWSVADAIYHGDLEPLWRDLIEALMERKRTSVLDRLSDLKSVSIPPMGKRGTPAMVRNLDEIPPVSNYLTPMGEFKNTLLLEIGRGCIRRCAFCVAGHVQKPVRFMKIETLEKLLKKTPESVKLGFISATITDYPWLEKLLNLTKGRRFSVSSMRMDGLTLDLLKALKRSGQRSFTVAPEGGSQKIRDILQKDIDEKDIENALILGREAGLESIKMYFIYGLEEETEEDLEAIVDLVKTAKRMGYKTRSSLNPLIPKPLTPFQNRRMQPMKILRVKERLLKDSFGKHGLKADFESIRESAAQRAIATATPETSEEIVDIFERSGKKSAFSFLVRRGDGS